MLTVGASRNILKCYFCCLPAAASGLLAEWHTTRVQDCIEAEAERINSGQQKGK